MSNVVYIVKETDEEKYKVGVTSNIEQRMRTLQTANPEILELVTTYDAGVWAFRIEAAFKKHYKNKKMQGEWFRLDRCEVDDFSNFCHKKCEMFKFMYDNNVFFKKIVDSGR